MSEAILIVEDDKELNKGLCTALKTRDRRLISCFNLKSAGEQLEYRPMVYLMDTEDKENEDIAEQYMARFTAGDSNPFGYESKATMREHFEQFKNMYLLLGGVLIAIIALVGILNFINAVMTGMITRKREFEVLNAIGMTKKQLRSMLIYEGYFYAVGSAAAAIVLSVVLRPMVCRLLTQSFWFFTDRFTLLPVILACPVLLLLGWSVPAFIYRLSR